MTMRPVFFLASLATATLALLTTGVGAAPAPLSIEAVTVSPESPGPGVPCTLAVRLKNGGARSATDFRFKVRIDGQDVATYNVATYAIPVAPGASDAIALNNFWTPAAAKPSFPVEVTLVEGRWAEVKREGTSVTVTPIGPIEGLPVSATQSVRMPVK